ncbi:MAG: T9SS type A sorting domain-containing protein [Chitinispirillia bacterium]|nr:T9SS type A sorting domain-containing protein [Chitinispirillia bacterium]
MSKKQTFVGVLLYAATVAAFFPLQTAAQQVIPIGSYAALTKIGADTDYPMNGNYELTGNIDASESRSLFNGRGHSPIGGFSGNFSDNHLIFTGTLDGKGFTIKGLYINRPDADYVGLFGAVGYNDVVIKNINIEADSITGKNYVGVIAGHFRGNINLCEVRGMVKGAVNVGGLIGYSSGSITLSGFRGTVSGDTLVGGLVGDNQNGGGSNSYFNGTVNGIHRVGGIAGAYRAAFEHLNSSGTVNGITNVGGLIGEYSRASFNARANGALSYSTAAVNGDTAVGGLIGLNLGQVSGSYSSGDVNGKRYVGGLIGFMGRTNTSVSIYNSYATGVVSGTESVGGLVGMIVENASIDTCYALGTVKGNNGQFIGGLAGRVESGFIRYSYAAGAVEDVYAFGGGLAGNNSGVITECYSVGNVSGQGTIGGLTGGNNNGGTVDRCYSIGRVNTTSPTGIRGGLIGHGSQDTVRVSYWDIETSGIGADFLYGTSAQTNVEASVGKTTGELMKYLNYATTWDFTSIWAISGHYPYLRRFPIQKLTYSAGANGSIKGSHDQSVNRGAAQAVIAVPNSGYYFVSWSDGIKTAERTDRFPASDSISVTARFGGRYSLTYRSGENGSLVGDTAQIVIESNSGTEVAAVADAGYHFVMWSDSVMTPRRTDANISSNIEVYAIFASGVSVRNRYTYGMNLPLVTLRGKVLIVSTNAVSPVYVRVINMTGRRVASFRSVGSANHSLHHIPAGAYIVEAKRSGQKMTKSIVLR